MSLMMSQGDGLTVITVASNPKSKWPLLCQILGNLCCSPVCSVAQHMKGDLTDTLTAFAVIQMIVGVLNLVFGIMLNSFSVVSVMNAPFGLGCLFLAIGIVSILAAKFPSPCLLVITVILNIVSVGLAITSVVFNTLDLAVANSEYCGDEICHYYRHLNQMIIEGLDIMMIVLAVLQLCVSISFCVLTLKALCKKNGAAKSVEDPQPYQPLLEDAAASPAC